MLPYIVPKICSKIHDDINTQYLHASKSLSALIISLFISDNSNRSQTDFLRPFVGKL